jgi:hypothetical protein
MGIPGVTKTSHVRTRVSVIFAGESALAGDPLNFSMAA